MVARMLLLYSHASTISRVIRKTFISEGNNAMNVHPVRDTKGKIVTNPPIAKFLFDDTRLAIVWLVVRVLLGWQWVQAGLHKLSSPAWMETGDALKGYWTSAVKIPAT